MKKLFLSIIALSFVFASCSGPQGPQGPPGFDGLNANVQAFEYEVLPSAWTEAGVFGDPNYGFLALAGFPELTNNLLSNGSVSGFYILSDGGQVPMPAIFYENGFSTNYDYVLYPGEIEFWVRESDNQTAVPIATQIYKIILVEGNFKTLPDFTKMTIEEVEAYLGIEEYKRVSVK
jgi:hypothetical protein